MNLKFFLDAIRGSLAFVKEQDFPDYPSSVFEAAAQTNWTANPADFAEDRVLDVRNIRRAVILIKISGTDTYDFTVINGAASEQVDMDTWYDLDGGAYTSEEGNKTVGVDCLGLDYIAVRVDAVSGSDVLSIEIVPVPYEE